MTKIEQAKEKIELLLKDSHFKYKDIQNVNYKPHPYCITDKHLTGEYMSLNDNTIRQLEKKSNGTIHCGMYTNGVEYTNGYKKGYSKCLIPYDEHTYDTVLMLQLKDNITSDIANTELKPIMEILKEHGIDGIVFIETEQKYRIND